MTQLSYQIPIIGNPSSSEDPKIHDALQQIQTVVNGGLGTDNFPTPAPFEKVVSGDHTVAVGTVTLTWSGGQTSAVETITHGLPSTPAEVLVSVQAVGSGQIAFAMYGTLTSTTFQVQGWSPSAFGPGTLTCSWRAVV